MNFNRLLKQKTQTNGDLLEIEVQTDEIENITKWTQFPSEDNKGWGIGKKMLDFYLKILIHTKNVIIFRESKIQYQQRYRRFTAEV